VKVGAQFRPGTRAFWGTTYAPDLTLFDQYLLRQLGGPPITAVLLVDHWKLSEMWSRLEPDQHYLARQANRVYLLRGVQLPGGGAFHPKTYVFNRRDEATLVVGSGNLTRRGIDAGKEVFTAFDTQTDEGLSTLRAWAAWIGRLVDAAGDEQLTRRAWQAGAGPGAERLVIDVDSFVGEVDDLARRHPQPHAAKLPRGRIEDRGVRLRRTAAAARWR
jgi:hypothetical protein